MEKLITTIFYGRSGAGKGTQANLLKEHLEKNDPEHKVIYIETGTELRKIVAEEDNFTSKLTKKIIESGKLMPAFMPIMAWGSILKERLTGNEHIIFDGIARRLHEAHIVQGAFDFYSRENPKIFVIDVSREWAFEHLKSRGRSDDTDEEINKRLDWYDENVVPAIEQFRKNDKFQVIEINGEQSIEEVHKNVLEALEFE
jgi:adenylate kinase